MHMTYRVWREVTLALFISTALIITTIVLMGGRAGAEGLTVTDRLVLYWKMQELNGWVRDNTEYKATSLPRVVFKTSEELQQLVFPGTKEDADGLQVVAAAERGIIYINHNWQPVRDDYVLVHELVHYQQFEAGKTPDTPDQCATAELEAEAYAVHSKFVTETGRGEQPDPMMVAMITMCGQL